MQGGSALFRWALPWTDQPGPRPHRSADELLAVVERRAAVIRRNRRARLSAGLGGVAVVLLAATALARTGDEGDSELRVVGPVTTSVVTSTTALELLATTTTLSPSPPSSNVFTMGVPGQPRPSWDPGKTLSVPMDLPLYCGNQAPCPPGTYTATAVFGPFRFPRRRLQPHMRPTGDGSAVTGQVALADSLSRAGPAAGAELRRAT